MRHLTAAALLALAVSACRSDPAARPLGSPAANLAGADDAAFPNVVTRRVFSAPLYGHPAFSRDALGGGNVSPDGNKMLLELPGGPPPSSDRAPNRDLAAFDFTTNQVTKLESTPDVWNVGVYSRDGRQIAFERSGAGGLSIASSDGSGVRSLFRTPPPPSRARIIQDWSPDGRTLLAVNYGTDLRHQLLLISVEDGSIRVLKSLAWDDPVRGRFSPDGRWIAYSVNPEDGAGEREVFVIATDGSGETQLTRTGLAKEVLGWSSQGDALLYWEWSRDGFSSVWRVPMAGGVPSAPAQRVRRDLVDSEPIQLVRDRVMYRTTVGASADQMFEVEIDPQNGAARGAPRLTSGPRQGAVASTAAAPDGARVAYLVRGTPEFLVIRSVATGAERETVPGLEFIERITRWAEDGESLFLEGQRQGVYGLYRYDLRSGQLSLRTAAPLPSVEPRPQRYLEVGADASVVYFGADFKKLVAHDLRAGTERVVFTETGARSFGVADIALSPDGKSVAYLSIDNADDNRFQDVRIVPADGGPARTVFKGGPDVQVESSFGAHARPVWSPDGRYLYIATRSPDPLGRRFGSSPLGPRRILQIPVGGGEPREVVRLDNTVLPIRNLSLSPDGRRIYFTSGGGSPDATGEIWVMENLTPASPPAKRR